MFLLFDTSVCHIVITSEDMHTNVDASTYEYSVCKIIFTTIAIHVDS